MTGRARFEGMRVEPHQHEEGTLTKAIEHYTSQIPSGVYLSAAIACVGASAALRLKGRKSDAQFVGLWAPTILLFGIYNKLVKVQGSE